MQLYVVYEHADGDVTSVTTLTRTVPLRARRDSIDAFQEVIVGAKINF